MMLSHPGHCSSQYWAIWPFKLGSSLCSSNPVLGLGAQQIRTWPCCNTAGHWSVLHTWMPPQPHRHQRGFVLPLVHVFMEQITRNVGTQTRSHAAHHSHFSKSYLCSSSALCNDEQLPSCRINCCKALIWISLWGQMDLELWSDVIFFICEFWELTRLKRV